MLVSSPTLAPPPAARTPTLADVVLGRDINQRRAVKRLLLVSHVYVAIWLWTCLSIAYGYSPRIAWLVVAYGMIGQSLFYLLLRSGYSLRFKDPLLCFPQLLFGIGSCTIGYAVVPSGQGSALQILFVLFIYDLHRLTPRQIGRAAILAAALLALTALLMWATHPGDVDLLQQLINIAMVILIIPMLSVVGRAVRRVHLAQLEKKAQLDAVLMDLKALSRRDVLTGATNRRHMMELLDDEIKRQGRTGRAFSVAMLDIDFFKRINDAFGHAVGDRVLQELTAMARAQLRDIDTIGRWGGEEFLILMPETSAADAGTAVDGLRERVCARDWGAIAPGLQVSFSCGIAEHADHEPEERTIERADAALYRTKQYGRNRIAQA